MPLVTEGTLARISGVAPVHEADALVAFLEGQDGASVDLTAATHICTQRYCRCCWPIGRTLPPRPPTRPLRRCWARFSPRHPPRWHPLPDCPCKPTPIGTMKGTKMKKILMVDDSPTVLTSMRQIIGRGGYDVGECQSGEAALQKVAGGFRPDLVITDLNMPGMDGIALIQALRKVPACRFLPILVLTTESGQTQRDRARAAGATGWLVKPVTPRQTVRGVAAGSSGLSAGQQTMTATPEHSLQALPEGDNARIFASAMADFASVAQGQIALAAQISAETTSGVLNATGALLGLLDELRATLSGPCPASAVEVIGQAEAKVLDLTTAGQRQDMLRQVLAGVEDLTAGLARLDLRQLGTSAAGAAAPRRLIDTAQGQFVMSAQHHALSLALGQTVTEQETGPELF